MTDLSIVKTLPLEAKLIFSEVYNKTSDINASMMAVMYKYKKRDSIWTIKKSIPIKTVIKKSGLFGMFNPSYYIEIPITSTTKDAVNDSVSQKLLEKLDKYNLIDTSGDIDHITFDTGDTTFEGIFKLVEHKLIGNQLFGKLVLDKTHKMYNTFIKSGLINKITGASAEFYNPVKNNNIIEDCDGLGWTVTINTNPANADCSI